MSPKDPRLEGIAMTPEEIDAYLTDRGHGVLAVGDDGDAYAIPISFGYDGERLFMTLLEFGERSEKMRHLERAERACLTVYDTPSRFGWRSVVARGQIGPVDPDERAYADDVLEDNAWRPSMFPPTAPVTAVHRYALTPDDLSGRRGSRTEDA